MKEICRTTNIIILFITYLITTQIFMTDAEKNSIDDRPIIGILAQETSHRMNNVYNNKYDSYIAASYVKYLESSGARVVPLWLGQTESYYEDILSKINGVIFPGGSASLNRVNRYAESGDKIFKIATRMNNNGDYFPIWGTCLGFELLTYLAANRVEFRCNCSSKNIALPLIFKSDFQKSRLFKDADSSLIKILQAENVTANFHSKCITEEGLQQVNLTNDYRVLSVNNDKNDLTFISTIEHKTKPFYATQYHPEKNNFEWAKRFTGIPHTSNAIKVSQYFSNFFVNEARKNSHKFPTESEEDAALIYNYPVTKTSGPGSSFEQCYLFKTRDVSTNIQPIIHQISFVSYN